MLLHWWWLLLNKSDETHRNTRGKSKGMPTHQKTVAQASHGMQCTTLAMLLLPLPQPLLHRRVCVPCCRGIVIRMRASHPC